VVEVPDPLDPDPLDPDPLAFEPAEEALAGALPPPPKRLDTPLAIPTAEAILPRPIPLTVSATAAIAPPIDGVNQVVNTVGNKNFRKF
jgi:hypothetical protein